MIVELVKLAEQMHEFCHHMEHGGASQRLLAKSILNELSQVLKHRDERIIYTLLQVSIFPKMNQLAQDLQIYQKIISKQWLKPAFQKKTPINFPCFESFQSQPSYNKLYNELNDNEQHRIDEQIQEIYALVDKKESL